MHAFFIFPYFSGNYHISTTGISLGSAGYVLYKCIYNLLTFCSLIGGIPPSKTILPVCNLRVAQVDSSILSFVFPLGIFEMAVLGSGASQ